MGADGDHRPAPERVIRNFTPYNYPRGVGKRGIRAVSKMDQKALRAAARAARDRALQSLRAEEHPADAAWDVEFPEPRHRGNSLRYFGSSGR
ncbi:hypothetical protein Misp03_36720 [Microbispora sp. NBRC 16548]|nr:hypothetical protein Misp03_36720 [Microbispora sp. NBRC 16548]